MRTEIANWTARQSKHAAVAYPLITYLICLEETNTFTQYVDTLVENLHRQLKVWPVMMRPLSVTCTAYLTSEGGTHHRRNVLCSAGCAWTATACTILK